MKAILYLTLAVIQGHGAGAAEGLADADALVQLGAVAPPRTGELPDETMELSKHEWGGSLAEVRSAVGHVQEATNAVLEILGPSAFPLSTSIAALNTSNMSGEAVLGLVQDFLKTLKNATAMTILQDALAFETAAVHNFTEAATQELRNLQAAAHVNTNPNLLTHIEAWFTNTSAHYRALMESIAAKFQASDRAEVGGLIAEATSNYISSLEFPNELMNNTPNCANLTQFMANATFVKVAIAGVALPAIRRSARFLRRDFQGFLDFYSPDAAEPGMVFLNATLDTAQAVLTDFHHWFEKVLMLFSKLVHLRLCRIPWREWPTNPLEPSGEKLGETLALR